MLLELKWHIPPLLLKKSDTLQLPGNNFHCKVLKYFKEKEWEVLISPYYNDNTTNKPREIDLIAEKAFPVYTHRNKYIGTINIRFFIECKYVANKTVFWFHNKDNQKAEDLVTKITPMTKDNVYTKQHHYLNSDDNVAKLFADERNKSAENEIFYKALNQSLNAMIYFRNKESIINSSKQRGDIKLTVNYPVIICNDFSNLYRFDIESEENPLKIDKNFLLEVNYAYIDSRAKNKNEYFLIDIVSFNFLDDFFNRVETEKNLFYNFLDE